MYLGTQIKPRDDSDYRVWAQLGVQSVCVDPPGNPHDWTDGRAEAVSAAAEKFGLTLDMVQLPLSSRPIEEATEPEHSAWQGPRSGSAELDSICRVDRADRRGGNSRGEIQFQHHRHSAHRSMKQGRGGSRNAAFRWSADQSAPPGRAGAVSEEENWARIDAFPRGGGAGCRGSEGSAGLSSA